MGQSSISFFSAAASTRRERRECEDCIFRAYFQDRISAFFRGSRTKFSFSRAKERKEKLLKWSSYKFETFLNFLFPSLVLLHLFFFNLIFFFPSLLFNEINHSIFLYYLLCSLFIIKFVGKTWKHIRDFLDRDLFVHASFFWPYFQLGNSFISHAERWQRRFVFQKHLNR